MFLLDPLARGPSIPICQYNTGPLVSVEVECVHTPRACMDPLSFTSCPQSVLVHSLSRLLYVLSSCLSFTSSSDCLVLQMIEHSQMFLIIMTIIMSHVTVLTASSLSTLLYSTLLYSTLLYSTLLFYTLFLSIFLF